MSEESPKTPEAHQSESPEHGALPTRVVEASGVVKPEILQRIVVAQAGLSPMLQFVESMDDSCGRDSDAANHDEILCESYRAVTREQ